MKRELQEKEEDVAALEEVSVLGHFFLIDFARGSPVSLSPQINFCSHIINSNSFPFFCTLNLFTFVFLSQLPVISPVIF